MTDVRPASEFPIEPWELRAYVSEDPSRTYRPMNGSGCLLGRYASERLSEGFWQAGPLRGLVHLVPLDWAERYQLPMWAFDLINTFDERFGHRQTVTGKQVLEAGILPRD